MKKLNLVLIVFIIALTFNTNAQSFTVTVGVRPIGVGSLDAGTVAKLPSLKKFTAKSIAINFKKLTGNGREANVAILAMNDKREEIGERVTVNNFNSGTITVPLTAAIRNVKGVVSLYMVKTSTDPDIASRERVAPILICTFK